MATNVEMAFDRKMALSFFCNSVILTSFSPLVRIAFSVITYIIKF